MIKRSCDHHDNIVVIGTTSIIDSHSEIVLEEAHRDTDISPVSAQPSNAG